MSDTSTTAQPSPQKPYLPPMTFDLDRLEALARAATPGPWQWVDPDTDLPCLPDAPCATGDHDQYAHRLSLRTVEEFSADSVGDLPKFIIHTAEEFHEAQQGEQWSHPDAEFIAACSPEVVLALIEQLRAKSLEPSAE